MVQSWDYITGLIAPASISFISKFNMLEFMPLIKKQSQAIKFPLTSIPDAANYIEFCISP